jgi:hypothetical protein
MSKKKEHPTIVCEFCKNEFTVKQYRISTARFCSMSCNRLFHSPQKKHGWRHTRLYQTWCNMKRRCYAVNWHAYGRYGGRGIKVCDDWKRSFVKFRDWALQNGYEDNLTIDRINVDGDYHPDNCRFVTASDNIRLMHESAR